MLDLYAEPYDPIRPQVCLDERPCVLHADILEALPMRPGQPVRYDYEYSHAGICNLFIACQPLTGWRHVQVTARRTHTDFAHCLRELVDVYFPNAQVIRVVLDHLNTHTFAALYTAFAPEEARRVVHKLEFHYTPKHGNWRNRAEIELGVLVKPCLNRRLGKRSQRSTRDDPLVFPGCQMPVPAWLVSILNLYCGVLLGGVDI